MTSKTFERVPDGELPTDHKYPVGLSARDRAERARKNRQQSTPVSVRFLFSPPAADGRCQVRRSFRRLRFPGRVPVSKRVFSGRRANASVPLEPRRSPNAVVQTVVTARARARGGPARVSASECRFFVATVDA